MKDDNVKRMRSNRVWLTADSCDLDAFKAQVERKASESDYPFASDFKSTTLTFASPPLLLKPLPSSCAMANPCTPGVSAMSPTTESVSRSTTTMWVPCVTYSLRADSSIEKLAKLKPAFKEGGTVTAGNSSPLSGCGVC